MTSIQFSEIQDRSKIIKAKEISDPISHQKPVKYYRHGWQSWSLAAWTDPSPMPVQKPAIFHPLQMDAEMSTKNLNGSWLGAVEFADGNILLLGALATDANCISSRINCRGGLRRMRSSGSLLLGRKMSSLKNTPKQLGNPLWRNKKERRAARLVFVVQPVHRDR